MLNEAKTTRRGTIQLSVAIAALTALLSGCAADESETATSEDEVESTTTGIVGGQTTTGYAAVGALVRQGSPFCTGTVVSPRVVVTAAHCLQGIRASSIRFTLGASAFAPQAQLGVARVVPHPQFDTRQLTNDIGVVILAQDAPVAPIALNDTMNASWQGRPLTFVGFGATNGRTGAGGGTKRAVSIALSQIGSTQFAYVDRTKNTCFGDSGGPAFAQDAAGNLLLAGVTSYGDQTCTQFGVDTRVDAFKSFIAAAQQ